MTNHSEKTSSELRDKATGPIATTKGTEPVFAALTRARESLFKQQGSDGHWIFPLEADASITAEYVMYRRMMELPVDTADHQAGERLLATQGEDGGWARYDGAPGHVSLTIEAYFALKLLGRKPDEEPLLRARNFILQHGGLAQAGVFTRFFLSYFRQYPDRGIPVVPVEVLLIPKIIRISKRQNPVLNQCLNIAKLRIQILKLQI